MLAPPRLPALVSDAHSRAAVAALRALGAAGIEAWALADRPGAAGLRSRHARARLLGPPSSEAGAWVARLAELAAERGPFVALPGQEEAVQPLVEADLPPEVVVPYPGPVPLAELRDKARMARHAAGAGVPSPRVLAEGPAAEVAARGLDAPVVLKARDFSGALPAVVPCADGAALRAALDDLPPDEPVVVQERLRAPLVAVTLVLDRDGRVAARLQQRSLRLAPAEAGSSAVAVTVAPDGELVARCAALLRSAGFWGMAQVQLLATEAGHRAIDVNPRPYGSLALALRAGTNLVAAWHGVAEGRPAPASPPSYRAGVHFHWLEGDVTAAMKGDRARLRALPPRPRAGAAWDPRDPLPGLVVGAEWAVAFAGRRLRRGG